MEKTHLAVRLFYVGRFCLGSLGDICCSFRESQKGSEDTDSEYLYRLFKDFPSCIDFIGDSALV